MASGDELNVFVRLQSSIERAHLALLDLRWEVAAVDELPPVSWEVEREQFLRKLPEA